MTLYGRKVRRLQSLDLSWRRERHDCVSVSGNKNKEILPLWQRISIKKNDIFVVCLLRYFERTRRMSLTGAGSSSISPEQSRRNGVHIDRPPIPPPRCHGWSMCIFLASVQPLCIRAAECPESLGWRRKGGHRFVHHSSAMSTDTAQCG